jgi:putrescine aminotransferase
VVGSHLHPFAPPARAEFVEIVRGEGAAVFDVDGRRIIDAVGSLWYCAVGHGRAEIADAVADQLRTLEAFNTFDRWTNGPADRLAEELATLAPMPDARVFFTSSGSEAVDNALKITRAAMVQRGTPERHIVISREHAYHGSTYGAVSAQGLPANKKGWGPLLPGVLQVPADDLGAVAAIFDENDGRVAAVLAEPVIGAGGVRVPVEGYLDGLRELCDDHDAFLILDEVICGFGRLGQWWGSERYGVVPDMVTFAKGVTSGYLPLGGVIIGRQVRSSLEADPDFVLRTGHTYSGHPACCVAASANIEILRREGLFARADHIGEVLGPGFADLADRGRLEAVRGLSGIWGVDLPDGKVAGEIVSAMVERGVAPRALGSRTLAFCPPLVIDDDDLGQILDVLGQVL